MGSDDKATARLRELDTYFRQHPRTASAARHTPTAAAASAPLNLGVIDHLRACVDEVVQHTRTADPQAGPAPQVGALYDWFREHTADSSEEQARVREAVIYRQGLEHAIIQGDTDIICTHPCPGCGTWGLQWSNARRRALCLNTDCRDLTGAGSMWSLGRIATHHIAEQEVRRRRAT